MSVSASAAQPVPRGVMVLVGLAAAPIVIGGLRTASSLIGLIFSAPCSRSR